MYVLKVRIKFNKTGSMKFIGHLDVMRYFQKAIRRSGLDIAYSQGFNPHQLISFAAPLGVGLTSDGEYMDMQLNSSFSTKEAMQKLNQEMNDEIRVTNYVALEEGSKNAMSIVAAADYLVSVKDGYVFPENYQQLFEDFLTQKQIIMRKKTKKSEREVDIKPYIYHVAFHEEDFSEKTGQPIKGSVAQQYENGKKIYLQITTGSVINIKPELVIEAFCKFAGIEYEPFAYQLHRLELYGDLHANPKADKEEYIKNRELVTLDSYGHLIEE